MKISIDLTDIIYCFKDTLGAQYLCNLADLEYLYKEATTFIQPKIYTLESCVLKQVKKVLLIERLTNNNLNSEFLND